MKDGVDNLPHLRHRGRSQWGRYTKTAMSSWGLGGGSSYFTIYHWLYNDGAGGADSGLVLSTFQPTGWEMF